MAEAKRKLAAILSADVAGYSRLMGDDERATMARLNACRDVFRGHVSDHHGRVVDTAGDSILSIFDSVVEAVRCAVTVQGETASMSRRGWKAWPNRAASVFRAAPTTKSKARSTWASRTSAPRRSGTSPGRCGRSA